MEFEIIDLQYYHNHKIYNKIMLDISYKYVYLLLCKRHI